MAVIRYFEKTVRMAECSHCGHIWQPRIERVPVCCPRCRMPLKLVSKNKEKGWV